MRTYEEYVRKSAELFSYIDGKYDVSAKTLELFKKEYSEILDEVIFSGSYPDFTPQNLDDGYEIWKEEGLCEKGIKDLQDKFKIPNNKIKTDEKVSENCIGKIATVKSEKIAIIAKSQNIIDAVMLINRLLYKTSPILIIRSLPSTTTNHIDTNKDSYPTTGWDKL